jgi:hypothetical protein
MTTPEPMSRVHVEACLERSGLKLTPAQIDEIHRISGYVRQSLERLGSDRPMEVEPALIFKVSQP